MGEDTVLSDEHVPIGWIAKAHGIKGEIKATLYIDYKVDFRRVPEILLFDEETEQAKCFTIITCREQTKYRILSLEGITNRNDAEALKGHALYIKKEFLPQSFDRHFYWHEIEGMQVVTDDGRELGSVTAMFSAGANAIMVVAGKGREYLIPAAPEFIVHKDDENRILTVSPVPGLLDINL